MIRRTLGKVFDRVADAYDAARPGYPDGLFAALAELAETSLNGALVVDVGAGTGISTRALQARGARVVAVDPGAEMLSRLVSRGAGAAVRADGNQLPLHDGVADLVCYAQSWHWLDPVVSVNEARRVLRRTGMIAAWWNTHDTARADWLAGYEAELAELAPEYWGPAHPQWRVPSIAAVLDVEERWVHWTRLVTVDDFLLDLRSHSYMAALDPGQADELVGRLRGRLDGDAQEGVLTVPMRVYLAVGR
ncbi:class I SAM-dependent methyltransferase [Nonomuraea soli]|uniref:SAM-dependent methyltransferase n=1 Tax=Nonomuraea soli TaxID=1032476 RepID=A0A7W0CJS1_9ACTN|nr:class I SAM-dependent methyltransferase [Nonomuraea soli]MBA2892217.1 SAM-dependent methyltransferase [Nonomuraea soli]